ncbi:putative chitinase 2 [Orchesella cincta]|uniref:Putative chitinase 2 n=1 Tax=Orchesella cincta TaxID=48709 RepID=A0A1D2MNU5_ORCCI|nr:putative chitinase 2 [Orchesella cincta]
MGFSGDLSKSTVQHHDKTVVCVLDSWSYWREGEGKFSLSDIDANLCTQLVYRNVGINNKTFEIYNRDSHLADSEGWFKRIVGLSRDFPKLKVLLSVGGWNEGSRTFSELANDYTKRGLFIQSVVGTLQKYGFHGLDLAWEYPAWSVTGGSPKDKNNLLLLLKELREAFGNNTFLALTVTGDRHVAEPAYNVGQIDKFVDQFNVRPMDFSGAWTKDQLAYHHAALRDKEGYRSVEDTIQFYLDGGAKPEKIVLGIPFYGRTFLLREEPPSTGDVMNTSGLEKPISSGFSGNWLSDTLFAGYHEICHNITKMPDWLTFVDNYCLVPFARSGKHWISFDNPESVTSKVNFAIEKKLKGVLAWTIDTDDFKGTACSGNGDSSETRVTYPLLRTINSELAKDAEKARETTGGAFRDDKHDHDNENSKDQDKKNKLKLKVVNAEGAGKVSKMRACFLVVSILFALAFVGQCQDINYFGVGFSPYVKSDGSPWNSYTVEDIKKMLRIVLTNHNSISTYSMGVDEWNANGPWDQANSNCLISRAAAQINSEMNSVVLSVSQGVYQLDNPALQQKEIDNAFAAAEEANRIRPGSVWSITFTNEYVVSESTGRKVIDMIRNNRDRAHQMGLKVGPRMHICGEVWNGPNAGVLAEIAQVSDFIMCNLYPGPNSNDAGAAVQGISDAYFSSRDGFWRHNPNVEVIIGETGWASEGASFFNPPNLNTIEHEKNFWNGMRSWATQNRVKVQMFEAFDEPWKTGLEGEKHFGWWRRAPNSESYIEKATGAVINP